MNNKCSTYKKQKANVFGFQSSYFEHTDQISWNRLWQMDRFNYFEVAMHLSYLGTLYLQTQWNLYIPNRFCVQNRQVYSLYRIPVLFRIQFRHVSLFYKKSIVLSWVSYPQEITSAMKKLSYKKGGLSWEGQISSVLLSDQCMWNLAL